MSILNLQVNTVAYSDSAPSNNPQLRAFDLSYQLLNITVAQPKSEVIEVQPNSTHTVFDLTRSTAIDGTSTFSITQPDSVNFPNTFRFTSTAGPSDVFRTNRAWLSTGTVLDVTQNNTVTTLTYGSGPALDTASIVVGDTILLLSGSGFAAVNQGRFSVIAKTATSVSFTNANGTPETATITDAELALAFDNGTSGNKILIGDNVEVLSVFSAPNLGTYEISEVAPEWFEVEASDLLLESGVVPTASGLMFYSDYRNFVLISAMQNCAIRVNGVSSDSVKLIPVSPNDASLPALYVQNGLMYSLIISNSEDVPATVTVLSTKKSG